MKAALTLVLLAVADPASARLAECAVEDDCRSLVGKCFWVAIPRSNPNTVDGVRPIVKFTDGKISEIVEAR
jgi:hypothetical protein